MTRIRLAAVACTFLSTTLALTSCATATGTVAAAGRSPAQEHRGIFTSGPGSSWFRPCGAPPSDEALWVTFTGEAVDRMEEVRREGLGEAGRPVFVRWWATTVLSGEIGPRGPGAPALLVRKVIEARAPTAGDCPPGQHPGEHP